MYNTGRGPAMGQSDHVLSRICSTASRKFRCRTATGDLEISSTRASISPAVAPRDSQRRQLVDELPERQPPTARVAEALAHQVLDGGIADPRELLLQPTNPVLLRP